MPGPGRVAVPRFAVPRARTACFFLLVPVLAAELIEIGCEYGELDFGNGGLGGGGMGEFVRKPRISRQAVVTV